HCVVFHALHLFEVKVAVLRPEAAAEALRGVLPLRRLSVGDVRVELLALRKRAAPDDVGSVRVFHEQETRKEGSADEKPAPEVDAGCHPASIAAVMLSC